MKLYLDAQKKKDIWCLNTELKLKLKDLKKYKGNDWKREIKRPNN